MPDDALDRRELLAARERVSARFLGRHGIHGVGVSLRARTVRVYTAHGDGMPIAEVQAVAAPFAVEVVVEPSAELL